MTEGVSCDCLDVGLTRSGIVCSSLGSRTFNVNFEPCSLEATWIYVIWIYLNLEFLILNSWTLKIKDERLLRIEFKGYLPNPNSSSLIKWIDKIKNGKNIKKIRSMFLWALLPASNSTIICCWDVYFKAAETSVPGTGGVQWAVWLLSPATHTPSTGHVLDWYWSLQLGSSLLPTERVQPRSGTSAVPGEKVDFFPPDSLPKWSVAHCPAVVGCNTSWIISFHCNQNAAVAAVNGHLTAWTGTENNLGGDWTVHPSSYKRAREGGREGGAG